MVGDEGKQVCVCMWVEENERNGDMEEGGVANEGGEGGVRNFEEGREEGRVWLGGIRKGYDNL